MLDDSETLDLIIAWLPPGGTVLDVGCGRGRILVTLAERGVAGMGIDPYASNAEHCRRLRAEEMNRLAERFDLVYALYALHHFDAPPWFPEKARSVLRPGGVLLIVDWVEGAQTGVPERYFAPQMVIGWVREAGFGLTCQEVRGQSMIIVGKLPPAKVEVGDKHVEVKEVSDACLRVPVSGVRGEVRETGAFHELYARNRVPQMRRAEGREAPLSLRDSDLWLRQ